MKEELLIPGTIFLVFILAIGLLIGLIYLGKFIFYSLLFSELKDPIERTILVKVLELNPRSFTNLRKSELQERNSFWETYGRIVICIFIIFIIAILLLTKVISAEAGLPILSAVSGFAIANNSSPKSSSDNEAYNKLPKESSGSN